MPYEVRLEPENKIIYVKVSGISKPENHYKAGEEALKIYKETNAKKLLVDLGELKMENVSTTECFNFGKQVAKSFPNSYIAHVLPDDIMSREDVKFTSTVEANRGGNTAEFESVEDARKWLLQK